MLWCVSVETRELQEIESNVVDTCNHNSWSSRTTENQLLLDLNCVIVQIVIFHKLFKLKSTGLGGSKQLSPYCYLLL